MPTRDLSSSMLVGARITGSLHGSLLFGQSNSIKQGGGLLLYSKPYGLFLATNATLVAIDFSKGNKDNGIVDSPSNQVPWRLSIVLASLLHGSPCTPYQVCSSFLIFWTFKDTSMIALQIQQQWSASMSFCTCQIAIYFSCTSWSSS